MDAELMQFSVVVVGKVHNPTILNPDFLAIQGIVPKSWGWEVADSPITSPPCAIVRYTNGVSITVEPTKLQVVDLSDEVDPPASRAPDIARQYVKTLRHVRYSAVGINFHSIVDTTEPGRYLKDRFLKSGAWDSSSHPVNAVGVRLVYPVPAGRVVLSLDAGEVERWDGGERQMRPAVIANANFDRKCKTYPADEEIASHLDHAAEDWATYQTILNDALRTQGQA